MSVLKSMELSQIARWSILNTRILAYLILPLLGSISLNNAIAQQNATDLDLPVCDSFFPAEQTWRSLQVTPSHPVDSCPENAALMFHAMVIGSEHPAEQTTPIGTCCPLPTGALTQRHSFHKANCPPGTVITGARLFQTEAPEGSAIPSYEVRCTEIDLEKFTLASPHKTLQLGYGNPSTESDAIGREELTQTGKNMIPASLRYGFGRISEGQWLKAGCVGYPWGSVATAIGTRDCKGFVFQKLELRSR